MQMIKVRKIHVATALILLALLFSAASLITNAQTILQATDVNLINIKSVYATVWFREAIPSGGWLITGLYNSWGRGMMHVLVEAYDLTGSETMTFDVLAPLWDKAHSSLIPIITDTIGVDATHYKTDVTIYVPNAQFYFRVTGPVGRFASLSYYLTV